jgi:NAD(P)H-flavin reductase
VKSFMLAPSTPFPFRVGQHVDLRLTAPDSYQAERSYSIASAPEEAASIELAIERLDDGEVSPFFHDVAEVGDAIELRGPIGGHFVGRSRRRSAAFAWRRLRCGTADVIFREELFALAARDDGFQLALALTREEPRRVGDFGRRVDGPMVAELVGRLQRRPVTFSSAEAIRLSGPLRKARSRLASVLP